VVNLPTGTAVSDVSQETISSVENVIGTAHADEVIGDSAENTIMGLRGLDRLLGGGGNDVIQGGIGPDAMDGGDGTDTASYEDATRPVTVDLFGGFAEGLGSDTLVGIEGVVGSNFADYLRGDSGVNALVGLRSDDVLEARAGDDFLDGGEGADAGDGGEGTDRCLAIEIRSFCES
jgi:serralysin